MRTKSTLKVYAVHHNRLRYGVAATSRAEAVRRFNECRGVPHITAYHLKEYGFDWAQGQVAGTDPLFESPGVVFQQRDGYQDSTWRPAITGTAGSLTGRLPSEPEMQSLPVPGRRAAVAERLDLPATDLSSLERRVATRADEADLQASRSQLRKLHTECTEAKARVRATFRLRQDGAGWRNVTIEGWAAGRLDTPGGNSHLAFRQEDGTLRCALRGLLVAYEKVEG